MPSYSHLLNESLCPFSFSWYPQYIAQASTQCCLQQIGYETRAFAPETRALG